MIQQGARERTYWPIVGVAFVSLLIFGYLDNIRGPFFSQVLGTFQLGDQKGAAFFGVASFLAFVGSYKADWVLNRVGLMGALRLGLMLMSVGFAGMAGAQAFWQLLFMVAIFGLGLGVSGVAQNLAVTEYSASLRRRQLLSALHSLYGLASLLAPLTARPFIAAGWSWQQVFVAVAALPMLLALSTWLLETPPETQNQQSAPIAPLAPARGRELGHFAWLAMASAGYLLAEISIGTRLVRHLEMSQGLAAETGSLWMAAFFILLFLGRLAFVGGLLNSWSTRRTLIGSALGGAVLILAGLWLHPLLIVISGLFLGPFYPLVIEDVRQTFAARTAQALTIVLGLGSLTVVIMHFFFGILVETFSTTWAMHLGPAGLVLAAALLLSERKVFASR